MIKVSVIVPVYNVEKYLEKCLDTLVNQTLKEMEIIVVDDGSTDGSPEIIRRYAEKYENILALHKVNGGLSDARNYGMPYAKGEYIAFVDSDDYVELNMYELLYEKAKTTDADMVECNLFHDYQEMQDAEYGEKIYDKQKMIRDGRSVVWNKIYRKEWLDQTGVVFPKGLIYEDVEFYCKIVPFVNKVEYIDEVLIHYVQRSSSINNKSTIKTKQILRILRNLIKYYKKYDIYEEYKDSLEYLAARIILCSSFMRMIRIEDRAERNNALEENFQLLKEEFPHWRKNPYLKEKKSLKSYYIRCMNKPVYYVLAGLLRMKNQVQLALGKNKFFK